jgi:hypothetical protein
MGVGITVILDSTERAENEKDADDIKRVSNIILLNKCISS